MGHILVFEKSRYQQVMEDPLGLNALLHDERAANSNRFFAHWTMVKYFRTIPFYLQHFTSPLDSVYAASAVAKTAARLLILLVLASFVARARGIYPLSAAAVLIAPLLQTAGFYSSIGLVHLSITRTFFYSLPLGLLLLFGRFFKSYITGESSPPVVFRPATEIALVLFGVFLSLGGSLNPGIVVLACPLILLYRCRSYLRESGLLPVLSQPFRRTIVSLRALPRELVFHFGALFVLSLYSLYIGTFNSENFAHPISIGGRYSKLPVGIWELVAENPGLLLLMAMVAVNVMILRRTAGSRGVLSCVKLVVVFSIAYTVLLPLGGYRRYIPNIVRNDTMMPVTAGLILAYAVSTHFLLSHTSWTHRRPYTLVIAIFLAIFTLADRSVLENNACERAAINQIAASSERIVQLNRRCRVMEWGRMTDYRASALNGELLYYWNITSEMKLYYQKR